MCEAAIPQTKSVARRRLPLRWVGGVLVLLLCFTAYLDRIAYSVTASPLMDELGITPVQFGMVTTLFSAGYFLAQMPAAALLQRFGSRPVLAGSLGLWSIFTAATGMVGGLLSLAAVRCLFGIAESPVFTGGNQFFSNWFKRAERGRGELVDERRSVCGQYIRTAARSGNRRRLWLAFDLFHLLWSGHPSLDCLVRHRSHQARRASLDQS